MLISNTKSSKILILKTDISTTRHYLIFQLFRPPQNFSSLSLLIFYSRQCWTISYCGVMFGIGIFHFILLMSVFHETVTPSSSWIIPPTEFLEAFAEEFQREGILIILPEIKSNKWHLQSIVKHFR